MDDYQAVVDALIPLIRGKVKLIPSIFQMWFGDLHLISLTDSKAVFTTPTNIRQGILINRYRDILTDTLAEVIGFRVEIEVESLEKEEEQDEGLTFMDPPVEQSFEEQLDTYTKITEVLRSDIMPPSINKNILNDYTFDNFIEGESNKFAKAACFAVANDPSDVYNPLFIWGQSGLGKTHLLCAIIGHLKKHHPEMRIRYKSSELFISELVHAIQNKSTEKFKEKYRSADVLLIDDIQFIAGKEATQEEFFHTFSALYESGKQIILASDRPPKDIRPLEDRLRTRFEGGLIADIQPPSIELRTAIIRKKAEEYGLEISNEDIDYIASRLRSNIRQIKGAMAQLRAVRRLSGDEINRTVIDKTISSVDPDNISNDLIVARVLEVVSAAFGVSVEDMKSKKKTATIADARHTAIYIIRNMTDMTFSEIGAIFGRDHSTVISSINKMEMQIKTIKDVEKKVAKIVKEIKSK